MAPRLVGVRYTRFVRSMRLALPLLAGALIVLVAAWPQIGRKVDLMGGSYIRLTPEDVESLQMLQARFVGTDATNRPYWVTAEKANQTAPNAKSVSLVAPKADITLQDGTWLAVTAASGLFQRDTQALRLVGDVNLYQDQGYTITTASAELNLKTGGAEGSEAVAGQGPMGSLKGQGFRMVDKGKVIVLTGHATVLFKGDTAAPKKPAPPPAKVAAKKKPPAKLKLSSKPKAQARK